MNPQQILKSLRLALASGAIEARVYSNGYPQDDINMAHDDNTLELSWMSSRMRLYVQPTIGDENDELNGEKDLQVTCGPESQLEA